MKIIDSGPTSGGERTRVNITTKDTPKGLSVWLANYLPKSEKCGIKRVFERRKKQIYNTSERSVGEKPIPKLLDHVRIKTDVVV
ncbi:unnamed protein product [Phytomonas sp. EM1]|nr:unnamed protein product [Phytomonas sp. EM1]|eukprot:CCW64824.1 unnamed protein product [Phytomonas sp. isolate EM1]